MTIWDSILKFNFSFHLEVFDHHRDNIFQKLPTDSGATDVKAIYYRL